MLPSELLGSRAPFLFVKSVLVVWPCVDTQVVGVSGRAHHVLRAAHGLVRGLIHHANKVVVDSHQYMHYDSNGIQVTAGSKYP